jgi:hypothetical protein
VVGEHPLLPFAPLLKRGVGARNAAFKTFVYGEDSSCFTDLWQAFLEENLQLKHSPTGGTWRPMGGAENAPKTMPKNSTKV